MPKFVSDKDFIAAWDQCQGSPSKVAKMLGLTSRNVYARRKRMAENKNVVLPSSPSTDSGRGAARRYGWTIAHEPWERRRTVEVPNGHVVVFTDAHFYPGDQSVAFYALLNVIKTLKPEVVICGGDALDGTQISRWEPTRGWHTPPALARQLEAMVNCMNDIASASGKARRYWTLGNHDARLSRYLAVRAPEVEDLPGTTLEDYLPDWPLSWSVQLNGNTIVRHRPVAGGLHSTYQSPLRAAAHFVHGHLHGLNVRVVPRYGLDGPEFHFGVDAGSLADATGDQFDYREDGLPHAQGFCVLTYQDGKLLMPELCIVQNGAAWFRGEPIA